MSDDDDDGVEPQIEDVNGYYFEDGEGEPVCFSILPFSLVRTITRQISSGRMFFCTDLRIKVFACTRRW